MTNWFYEELQARHAAEAFAKHLREQELIRSLDDGPERAPSALRRRVAATIVGLGLRLDPEAVPLQTRPAVGRS